MAPVIDSILPNVQHKVVMTKQYRNSLVLFTLEG